MNGNNYPLTPPANVSDCWSNTSRMFSSEYRACGLLYCWNCALIWFFGCVGAAGLDKPPETEPLPVIQGLVIAKEQVNQFSNKNFR